MAPSRRGVGQNQVSRRNGTAMAAGRAVELDGAPVGRVGGHPRDARSARCIAWARACRRSARTCQRNAPAHPRTHRQEQASRHSPSACAMTPNRRGGGRRALTHQRPQSTTDAVQLRVRTKRRRRRVQMTGRRHQGRRTDLRPKSAPRDRTRRPRRLRDQTRRRPDRTRGQRRLRDRTRRPDRTTQHQQGHHSWRLRDTHVTTKILTPFMAHTAPPQ
jgi:hypothetical protein